MFHYDYYCLSLLIVAFGCVVFDQLACSITAIGYNYNVHAFRGVKDVENIWHILGLLKLLKY